MSKKSPKIAALIADCAGDDRFDAHYLSYFKCFNAQFYYEAHDVLEELWLADKHGPNGAYYKGLIQLAGGFVHLQKQYLHPEHRVHGQRLAPAARLFQLALDNLSQYPEEHEGLNLKIARTVGAEKISQLEKTGYKTNPWSPEAAPALHLN